MNIQFSQFKNRQYIDEWMDDPEVSAIDLTIALAEIRWVNRYLGGTSIILNEIKRQSSTEVLRLLDLGTGSADIPRSIVHWARRQKIALKVIAVDLNPIVIQEAKRLCYHYPEIECHIGNALNLPFADDSFDFAISSMFLHHLSDKEAVILLKEMARLAKRGFAINDLQRHPMAWLGIQLLGRLTSKSKIFLNDAPLSVLRSFSYDELHALCRQANLPNYKIESRHPFRWLITHQK